MGSQTANPYLLPFPYTTDSPDVPRDIKALADRVHSQLTTIDTRITNLDKSIDARFDKIDTSLKTPSSVSSNVLTQSSGFTISAQVLWRWGLMACVDFTVATTSDRTDANGDIKNIRMGTWKTTAKPLGIFPLSSTVDGLMALGYTDKDGVVLSTIEANNKWAKNTKIRFSGFYFTDVVRT